ncbi:alpha/beta hydrolase [Pseudonocardia sp. GCM10023141]|uniref:alpha/beta hydrolase n=1 Tax=Pseudonocardia sp. GCM10023141 TaxID=3252653 RepID=UPI00361C6C95
MEEALIASPLLDAPLIAGVLPSTISVVGGLALVYLLVRRGRRWWLRTVSTCIGIGVLVAALSAVGVALLRPFPDPLPLRVLFWIAVTAAGCALAWAPRGSGRLRVAVTVLAVVAVLLMGAVKVNAFYGYRPTLASAVGLQASDQTTFADLPREVELVTASAGMSLAAGWTPPPDMPATGQVAQVSIPGTASGFAARPAWLYLPPAYLGSIRAELPVLVLIPGQPGGPDDWLLAGQLANVLDRFAAAHHGLAPVVIVPDTTGSSFGNPLCLDSRLGNAETYLAVDVPAWETEHLQVRHHHRAIGGFSFGGTCSLQLAVRRPEVYPTFLDIAGQAEPTLGDRAQTVQAAFGGDDDAFRLVNPLDVLKTAAPGRYVASAGILTTGRDDALYGPEAARVRDAAAEAGLPVQLISLPGGHSWPMAIDSLTAALPWIADRAGLVPAPPLPH